LVETSGPLLVSEIIDTHEGLYTDLVSVSLEDLALGSVFGDIFCPNDIDISVNLVS